MGLLTFVKLYIDFLKFITLTSPLGMHFFGFNELLSLHEF